MEKQDLNIYQEALKEMEFKNPEVKEALHGIAATYFLAKARNRGVFYRNLILTLAEAFNDDKPQIYNFLQRDIEAEANPAKRNIIPVTLAKRKPAAKSTVVAGCTDCGSGDTVIVNGSQKENRRKPLQIQGETFIPDDAATNDPMPGRGQVSRIKAGGNIIEVKNSKKITITDESTGEVQEIDDVSTALKHIREHQGGSLDDKDVEPSLHKQLENTGKKSAVPDDTSTYNLIKEADKWVDVMTYFGADAELMLKFAEKNNLKVKKDAKAEDMAKQLFSEIQFAGK